MRHLPIFVIALALFLYAGCNVFEGLYEEGGSDDPEVLLEDAQAALQRGDTDKAVQYLEKAYERDSTNPTVGTKLSTALLQQADINVVTMIDLTEELSGGTNGAGKNGFGAPAGKSSGMVACNFGGTATKEIDLTNNPAYLLISGKEATLRRLKDILDSVINSASFNILPEDVRKEALLNQAIVKTLIVLVEVQEKRVAINATLWQLPNKDVGLCANTEADLLEMQQFVKCEQIPEMREALAILVTRLGAGTGASNSASKESIEQLEDAIDKLEALINVSCS